MEHLEQQVKKFCDDRAWEPYHGPKDLAIGVVTEAAELLDLFRFQSSEQCQTMFQLPEKREAIEDELADVLFFLLRMSELNGINLKQALKNKLIKNAKKYPVEEFYGKNHKYSDS